MTSVVENNTFKISEGSTPTYAVTLLDNNSEPILDADITSIEITYKDDLTGDVINNREDQDVYNDNGGTFGITDGLFSWELDVGDSVLMNSDYRFETHLVVLTWTWDGGAKQQKHAFYVQVENLGRTCWQNFINRVALRIGAGRRTIEMTDDHWCEAVSQSMDLINTYLYRPVWAHLGVVNVANTRIRFADQVNEPENYDPQLRAVVRVMFFDPNSRGSAQNTDDPFVLSSLVFGGGYYGGYGGRTGTLAPAGRYGVGDIFFWQQQEEAVSRVLGTEPDWLWDTAGRQLAIEIPNLKPLEVSYIKAYSYTPANLLPGYFNYFLKALEGYARMMLGGIRGKFGGQIPGPTGTTETDSQAQIQKGESLISEVEDTLRRLPLQAVPETG